MNNLRLKDDEEFEAALPMSWHIFKDLFNYLDIELNKKSCCFKLAK
jgi:hypothetical protein